MIFLRWKWIKADLEGTGVAGEILSADARNECKRLPEFG